MRFCYSGSAHSVLPAAFSQRAFSDVNDLVNIQGLTCGKFGEIVY